MALGGPGVTALRALSRVAGGAAALAAPWLRDAAGKVAWGFRTLFNGPEVMALVRGMNREEPYWRRVVEYGVAGGLQAVLDEYAHVLQEIAWAARQGRRGRGRRCRATPCGRPSPSEP